MHGLKVNIDYAKLSQWLEIIRYHGHPKVRLKYINLIKEHLDEAVRNTNAGNNKENTTP